MLERQLIRSAAPTLAGLKTGSLFPYRFLSKQAALVELRALEYRLTPKGLRLLPLRMTDRFAMLYLYRPERLQQDLRGKAAAKLLRDVGYPDTDASRCLAEISRRLCLPDAFPHEIGLFLSYPPEDVQGFMERRPCKCVGCWKVYGDERAAKRIFAQYEQCTSAYLHRYALGCPLERLAVKL